MLLLEKDVATVFLELRVSNVAALAAYCAWGFTQQGLRKKYYPAVLEGGEPEDALLMTLILKERLAAC
jgi:ribosomal-protein-alanine N-acetyltransferase